MEIYHAPKYTETCVLKYRDLRILALELVPKLLAVGLEALDALLLRRGRFHWRVAIARSEHVGRHCCKRKKLEFEVRKVVISSDRLVAIVVERFDVRVWWWQGV